MLVLMVIGIALLLFAVVVPVYDMSTGLKLPGIWVLFVWLAYIFGSFAFIIGLVCSAL